MTLKMVIRVLMLDVSIAQTQARVQWLTDLKIKLLHVLFDNNDLLWLLFMSELLAGSKNLYHLKCDIVGRVSHYVKDNEDR